VNWINRGITRKLTLSTVAVAFGVFAAGAHLGLNTLIDARAGWTAGQERSALRYDRLVDDTIGLLPRLGDRMFAEEDAAIAAVEREIRNGAIERVRATGPATTERYSGSEDTDAHPDSYRARIKNRDARKWVSARGFAVAAVDDKLVVYTAVPGEAGPMTAVEARLFPVADAERAKTDLEALIETESKARDVDGRRARLADLKLPLERLKTFAPTMVAEAQARKAEIAGAAARDAARVAGETDESLARAGMIACVIAVVGLGTLVLLIRRMTRIVVRVGHAMESAVAARDDETALSALIVPGRDRIDEIGALARGVDRAARAFLEIQGLRAAQADERRAREEARRELMRGTARAFDDALSGTLRALRETTETCGESARGLAVDADETTRRSDEAMGAARRASGAASTVAAATEELSCSIDAIRERTRESSMLMTTARDGARGVVERVSGVDRAADRVTEAVALIGDVAQRTNMLALNATIEAARAGEAGRGFAVVAAEVRDLAMKTTGAAAEVGRAIDEMRTVIGAVTTLIGTVENAVDRVSEASTEVFGAVEEQGSTAREIARSIAEAAEGTETVVETVERTDATAGRTAERARLIREATEDLIRLTENLSRDAARFATEIEAAG